MRTIEWRDQFVRENWTWLAARAYRGYQTHGRGALIISSGAGGLDVRHARFVPLAAQVDLPGLDPYLRAYDPEREIVVVFELQDTAPTIERYDPPSPDATPPKAYQAMLWLRRLN